MRSLSITIIVLTFSLQIAAGTSNDTTYSKEWDSRNESWVYFDRVISSYEGKLLRSELIQIFEENKWVNYNLQQFMYNNGQMVEELEFYWDEHRDKWLDNYRKLYSYDSGGKLTKVLHQNIFQGNYINSSQELYYYSDDGLLNEKVVQTFDEAWSNFLKYQYYYNSKDLILEENLTYWKDDHWGSPSFSIHHQYNQNSLLTEKVKIKYCGKKKLNLNREQFVHNSNGRLDEQIVSQWNSQAKKWVNMNRAVYVNDLNGYVCSMISQAKDRKEWVNYLFTEFTGNNFPLSGMDIAGGMTFTIYPINFGKLAKVEFKNPHSEEFNVKIINERGDVMASAFTAKEEVVLDARKLIKGTYFVELQGSNLFSGKFSIK
jgi:hypothetical protein